MDDYLNLETMLSTIPFTPARPTVKPTRSGTRFYLFLGGGSRFVQPPKDRIVVPRRRASATISALAVAIVIPIAASPVPTALAASPSSSRAAPAPPRRRGRSAASPKRRAKTLFFKGLRAFATRRYPDALAFFTASYRLVPKNVVLYNIAMCHRALFQYTAAIRAFGTYLKRKGRRLPRFRRTRIERIIQTLSRRIGRLVLHVTPDGARVRVDGRPAGRTPLPAPLQVDPGQREVEVSHPDRQTATLQVTVASGQTVRLSVALPPTNRQGRLVLDCAAPGCQARVDGGRPISLPATVALVAGRHRVRAGAPGYMDQSLEVHVAPDGVLRRSIRLVRGQGSFGSPSSRRLIRKWWFWTLISAAAVAVATSTGLLVWDQTRSPPAADLTWRLR